MFLRNFWTNFNFNRSTSAPERVERFAEKWWGALILCALPFFLILLPYLSGLMVFSGQITGNYPIFYFYKQAIINNDSFLWNPLNYSGFPFFVSVTGGFLSPLVYGFFRFLSVLTAYHLLVFLAVSFVSFFTYLFLRRLKIGFWPAFGGGAIFGFSQMVWVDDLPITIAMTLLPLLFLLCLEIYSGKKWTFIFLALTVACGFLSAHFHYFLESLFAAGLFCLFLLFWDEENSGISWKNWKKNIRVLLKPACAFAAGIILSLYQIIPAIVYTFLSAGRSSMPHWEAVENGIRWGDALKIFSPTFDIWFIPASYDKFYFGILPVLFLFVSFWFAKNYIIKFFYFLLAISVLLALNNSWLFWVIHHIPPFNLIHISFRWMFVGWFAFAVIVAWAMERIWNGEKIPYIGKIILFVRWSWIMIFSVSFVGNVIIYFFQDRILGFAKTYFLENLYSHTSHLPLDYYYNYIDRLFFQAKTVFDFSNLQFTFSLVFIVAAWYLLKRFAEGGMDVKYFVRFSSVLIVVNLTAVWFPFFYYEQGFSRIIFDKKPETVKFLREYAKEGRTLSFLKEAAEFEKINTAYGNKPIPPEMRFIADASMLFADTNLYYGFESAEIYEPLMSKRMARFMALLGSDLVWSEEKLADLNISVDEKIRLLESRKNLLDFLGIRYIVSAYQMDEKIFPKIFETKIMPPLNVPVAIYENKEARPLFYFADSLETILENETVAFEKIKNISEKGLGVFAECPKSSEVEPPRGGSTSCKFPLVDGKGIIEIKTKKNTVSILKIKTESPEFLVFSENHLPGWRAYVDGNETPIYTVGSVYIGIGVPAGEHEVKFRFEYSAILKEFVKLVWKKFNFFDEFR